MSGHKTISKGFTLVELIVVIAIIAILTAVFIPSLSRFIDDARLSNDQSAAASMTDILQGHLIINEESDLDAYDVKEIIDTYNGSPFSYTPTAVNTGFFYLSGSNRVVALKYEEAGDFVDVEALLGGPRLMSDQELDSGQKTPEELFGAGKKLMTRDGSAVAIAVSRIYDLANSGSLLDAIYTEVYDNVDTYADSLIARFVGLGISTELKEDIIAFLNEYHPEKTLFVNSAGWTTKAGDGHTIDRVVFAEGISNLPEFDLGLEAQVSDDLSLELPKTIKTVESGALPKASMNVSLKEGALIDVITEDDEDPLFGKFTSTQKGSDDLWSAYSDDGLVVVNEQTTSFDLNDLLDYLDGEGQTVTSYRIEIDMSDKTNSVIHIYTKDGYYGFVMPLKENPENSN